MRIFLPEFQRAFWLHLLVRSGGKQITANSSSKHLLLLPRLDLTLRLRERVGLGRGFEAFGAIEQTLNGEDLNLRVFLLIELRLVATGFHRFPDHRFGGRSQRDEYAAHRLLVCMSRLP